MSRQAEEIYARRYAILLQRCVDYKPEIVLSFRAEGSYVVFHLDARVADSRTRTPNTAIGYTHIIPIDDLKPYGDHLPFILAEVRKALHKFEQHESDEWLQFNGVQVHPPHHHYPTEQQ